MQASLKLKDGTEFKETEVVKEMLLQWVIKKEVIAMVFDTTSSNTRAEIGACRCLDSKGNSEICVGYTDTCAPYTCF